MSIYNVNSPLKEQLLLSYKDSYDNSISSDSFKKDVGLALRVISTLKQDDINSRLLLNNCMVVYNTFGMNGIKAIKQELDYKRVLRFNSCLLLLGFNFNEYDKQFYKILKINMEETC